MGTAKEDVLQMLVERRRREPPAEVVREKWLDELGRLLASVREWCAEGEARGLLRVLQDDVTLVEEPIGTYHAPSLRLEMRRATVQIVPVGRTIIGALGRVDVTRPPGRVILLRERAGWVIAERRSTGWDRRPLDEEAFWAAIKELIA